MVVAVAVAAAPPSLARLLKSRRVTKLVKRSRLRRTELIMVTYFSVLSKIIYPTAAAAGVFLPLVRLMALASCIYTQQRE